MVMATLATKMDSVVIVFTTHGPVPPVKEIVKTNRYFLEIK